MHENSPVLSASKREKVGTRYAQRVREQGGMPAIVYGHKETPLPISVPADDVLKLIEQGEKVFRIGMGEGEPQIVLLKDVQFDYLGTNIVHCDFARVDLNERVHTRVPLHLIGDPVGLKTAHTVLMHHLEEIEIECAVKDLPDSIEHDISDLEAGATLHASDVPLPSESMSLVTDPNAAIVHIVIGSAHDEDESDEASAVSADGAGEPEVITERKADEDKD